MAMYLGSKKVAVTNTVEKQIPSMKAFFDAGGKCAYSKATSFEGIIQYADTANVTNMDYMFYSCYNLESLDVSGWNTSNVKDMSWMFYRCYNLKSIDLPGWDTSNVKSMVYMFKHCPAPYRVVGNKLRKK